MSKQALMYVMFGVAALLAYAVGVALIVSPRSATWLLLTLPIVVSPGAMALLRLKVERVPLDTAASPRTQSWAFMFGDSIFLPTALFAIGMGHHHVPAGFFTGWLWTLLALVIGAGAGLGFHVMDSGGYRSTGAADALVAPTKIWHDFVVYPVLFGLLLMGGVPMLLPNAWSPWTIVALTGILGWLVLGLVCDQKRSLNPLDMHPRWDARGFVTIN